MPGVVAAADRRRCECLPQRHHGSTSSVLGCCDQVGTAVYCGAGAVPAQCSCRYVATESASWRVTADLGCAWPVALPPLTTPTVCAADCMTVSENAASALQAREHCVPPGASHQALDSLASVLELRWCVRARACVGEPRWRTAALTLRVCAAQGRQKCCDCGCVWDDSVCTLGPALVGASLPTCHHPRALIHARAVEIVAPWTHRACTTQ